MALRPGLTTDLPLSGNSAFVPRLLVTIEELFKQIARIQPKSSFGKPVVWHFGQGIPAFRKQPS
jgi:hypothetical protein